MARLPYLNEDDLAPENRDLLSRPINLFRLLTHSPNAARAFHKLGMFIRHESLLDARLRELAILTVGYLTEQPYEYSHHVKLGQEFGVSKTDLGALTGYLGDKGGGTLTMIDKAVVDAARQLTERRVLTEETYTALETALSSEELIDLVVTISFYNGVVRLLGAFEVDVEDDYAPYLEEFPLPSSNDRSGNGQ